MVAPSVRRGSRQPSDFLPRNKSTMAWLFRLF